MTSKPAAGIRGTPGAGLCVAALTALLLGLALSAVAQAPRRPPPPTEQLVTLVRDRSQSDRARIRAASALVRSGDPEGLPVLMELVKHQDERVAIRAEVARLLGRAKSRETVAAFLRERLEDRAEAVDVRAGAATGLGALGLPASREVLERVTSDPAPPVRLAARLGLLDAGGARLDRVAILKDLLEDAVQPGPPRAVAAGELGQAKDPRALPPLLNALRQPGVPETSSPADPFDTLMRRARLSGHVPAAAARALGQLGDPAAISALVALAQSPDLELRLAVFEALAALRAREAVPAARAALGDPDLTVRRRAALLLKEVGAREAVSELRQALRDTDPGVRLQAAQALGALRDGDSAAVMEEVLKTETTPEVRDALRAALSTLRP